MFLHKKQSLLLSKHLGGNRNMQHTEVILRPVITEKSLHDAQKGMFTFLVATQADKKAIKKAIENTFSVHVIDVATQLVKGKRSRQGKRRLEIKASPIKKAKVTLISGEKIDLFTIPTEGEKK